MNGKPPVHEYVQPVLSAITADPATRRGATIILPGGVRYRFNGVTAPIPRGPRPIEITLPGRGSRNTAPPVRSPLPIGDNPRTVPLPARKGLRLGKVSLAGVGVMSAVERAMASMDEADGVLYGWAWAHADWDADAMTQVLTQPQPCLERARVRMRVATMTKEDTKRSQQRIKIHGYSRKGGRK